MSELMRAAIVCFSIFGVMLVLNTAVIYASDKKFEREESAVKGYRMKATAYCLTGTTATGTQTRSGICAAKRDWFGKRVAIYTLGDDDKVSQLIGYYVVEDTGGKNIRKGKVIDIWMPTEDECFEFGKKDVVVFLMD